MLPDEAHPNHAVHTTGEAVHASSAGRLVYEVKDWQRGFGSDIRRGLKEMSPGTGRLVAELYSWESDPFDVENVLFYNVGTASFASLTSRGLAFRRYFTPAAKMVDGLP